MEKLWISIYFAVFSCFFCKSIERNDLVEYPILLYNKLENYPSKRYLIYLFIGDGGTLLWLKRIKNILTGSTLFSTHWSFIVPSASAIISVTDVRYLKGFFLVSDIGDSYGSIRVYFLFWFLYTLFYMRSLIYINQKDFRIRLPSMRILLKRTQLEWFSSLYILYLWRFLMFPEVFNWCFMFFVCSLPLPKEL